MKHHLQTLVFTVLCLSLVSTRAQFGPPTQAAPQLGGSTAKLFGENTAYSATMEMQAAETPSGGTVVTPGRIAVLDGKSRFEMDMTQMKGDRLPAQAAEQMKMVGMDKLVMISRPDKKVVYMVYPNLKAYTQMMMQNPDTVAPPKDFKLETTELGKETLDGHPCVKNKAVVTDGKGNQHESTVWNATDLKNFPIKIETTGQGQTATMLFKDVKLAKPDASLFEPPTDYKHYDNPMELMQQEMMKRMGGGGMPGGFGHPPGN